MTTPLTAPQPSTPTARPADDEHLRRLLGWLHRLLAWQIGWTRHSFGELADDPYRGLHIPDGEIDVLAAGPPEPPPELLAQRAELEAEWQALADWAERRAAQGQASRPQRLAARLGLSRFELAVVLLALAPEIDLRYERIFGYIQDDVTRRRPTIDLALRLLCPSGDQQLAARACFTPDAPLLRGRLIRLIDDGGRLASPLACAIRLDDRIVAELLGIATIDPLLAPFMALERPTRHFDQVVLADDLRTRLRRMIQGHPHGLALALQGPYGSGRRVIAEALCAEHGMPLLRIDLNRLLESDLPPEDAAHRIVREGRLWDAALLFQPGDRLLQGDDSRAWRAAMLAALDGHPLLSFWAIGQPWEARGAFRHTPFLRVELPPLSYAGREQIWQQQLGAVAPPEAALAALSSTFRLSGGQIRDAALLARVLAGWRADGTPGGAPTPDDLYAACRAQSSGRLGELAQKITVTYGWDDIVLPPDQLRMLREICAQVRHRRTVLERWGFDRRLAMGKGVNVLVAGPSGTGKTMAAEILASDLQLELYKVDLSSLVSKYIGETEKNLDRIFTAAHEANAILFFDEADAVFGKRSEVKDAHDRYANIEVGYLLQKMEEYDGVVVLATNLRKNMDDAFVRRLHVAIDFPFPEEEDRLRIWRRVFPSAAPLADDVDLGFLARQFQLPGGNIRNIALLAAFLAAEDGTAIGMNQLIRATRREYQKLGKLVTEADFGPYMALLRRR